jgi:hypothetical protein
MSIRLRLCVRTFGAAAWPLAQMGSANDLRAITRLSTALNQCGFRRLDRSSSLATLLNPRHRPVGQTVTGGRRYASPRAIITQMVRAILLARATAAIFRGRRSSNCNSQVDAVLRPDLAKRITAMAPTTSNCRSLSLPALLMLPRRCLPPVEYSRGVNPSHAAK